MKIPIAAILAKITIASSVVFAWTAMTGCAAPSINLQLSSLRSTGDVASTVYLDDRAIDGVPKRQAELKKLAEKIAEFLSTGNAAKLTETKIRDGVLKLVPEAYRSLGESLLESLSKRKLDVDVQVVGAANIARLKAFLHGIVIACDDYKIDLRKEEEAAAAKAAAEVAAAAEAAEPEPTPTPVPAVPETAAPAPSG